MIIPSHVLTAVLQNSGLIPLRRADLIEDNSVLPLVAANTPQRGILVVPIKATSSVIVEYGWPAEGMPTDDASTLDFN